MILNRIFDMITDAWHKRNSDALIKYYRKKGLKIGERCILRSPERLVWILNVRN